jgi:hypothetical protein
MGIEEEIEPEKFFMFAAGHYNEDAYCARLEKGLPPDLMIKREEEIPISWTTKGGTVVSGRPDVVVCTKDGVPQVGVELKLVCSVWTAKSVAFDFEPKSSAVVQAAHYSKQLGVPFELVYTNSVQYVVPDWSARAKMFDPASPYVTLNAKGAIKQINPFQITYDVQWHDGQVFYAKQGDPEWKPTIITWEATERFFDLLDTLKSMKRLGPRPSTYDCYGKKQTFDNCDYCSWNPYCDKFESSYDAWFSAIRKVARK